MRCTYIRLLAATAFAGVAALPASFPARAADEPMRVESVLAASGQVTLYADPELTRKAGQFSGATLFPTDVLEETPLGAVRIQVKGVDYWADADKLRIKRPTPRCMTVSKQATTAADRGANEGCARSSLATAATATAPKKP